LMNVEKYNAYVRLLIDNAPTEPFNIHCFPLPEGSNPEMAGLVKGLSRLKYGRERQTVIAEITERSKIGQLGKPPERL
ncbi:MAG: hypothetical protein AAB791_01560, partial [Patescibacteria group bacterium]